jgi:hypothetical protein
LIYFTLVHGKPYVSTFCAAFDTPQSRRIQPTFSRFPDEASIALLQELGVRWVVVSSRQYRQYWGEVRATIEALGLRLAFEADGQYVYELAPGG